MAPTTQGRLMTHTEHIVIRSANPADEQAIAVLGVLDGGHSVPSGRVLVAEVAGRIRAAVGSDGVSISDPFWPSAHLVNMLRVQTEDERSARTLRFMRRPSVRMVAAGI